MAQVTPAPPDLSMTRHQRPAAGGAPPIFVSIENSIASPDNHQQPAGATPQYPFAVRFLCCCLPCRKGGAPTTPGPFTCERKGCTNTHGNWDAEHQEPNFPLDNGLPRIGYSGFCSYECAIQTYFDIKYEVCCISEGSPILSVNNDIDCACGCCAGIIAQLCCMRKLYNPADEKIVQALKEAGRNPSGDVEMGGAHCCCYTGSPNWGQNTESLEVDGVGLYVQQIQKRDGMARLETNEELLEWLQKFDEGEMDIKNVISPHVLASEKLYDSAYTEHVKMAAAQLRTVECTSKPLQNCTTIFELYRQARACEPRLAEFLRNHGTDPNKMHGDGHASTSLKGIRRAMTKIKMSYGGNILALTDVCRGSVMFSDIDKLGKALSWLIDNNDLIQVLRIKNRFLQGKAAPGGYRDVLINCRFPNDPTNHVFEVQLHLKAYHDLKTSGGGHKIYKIARFIEAVLSPTSTFNLAKAIKEELSDDRKRDRYHRVVERAVGPILSQTFRALESKDHPGTIRGEKDRANLTVAYIGMCVGGAIAAEMASGGLAQQSIVRTPCPRRPKPRSEEKETETAVLDEAEQTNNAAIETRSAEIQARVLGLLCEIHSIVEPVLLAEGGLDKDTLDLRGVVMAQFADDWMYTKELESIFDEGAFSDVLDSNASGSVALSEVEAAIRTVLIGFLDYDDTYIAHVEKKKVDEKGDQD